MAWFFSTLGNHVRSWGAPLTGSVRPCTLFFGAKAGCDCCHLLMGRSAVAMTCTQDPFPRRPRMHARSVVHASSCCSARPAHSVTEVVDVYQTNLGEINRTRA